ncbi:hypothetical protein M378DRAFT_22743 [Amanita muscaria Koide BX008]|uniref:Cullin family profile domain-containing protein n=1 Tax=Amanita muscaria (strain Koide BX008) TaxID=946122 RepID=A0A0C2XFE0_AMAMK|nr:hypothetical protein M378DRAFT_22743 [Amanita muscaria Koide BX008]
MATALRSRTKPKIKPPRQLAPEFSSEETWTQLATNIREIQNQNARNLSFEENHRFGYNLVLYRHGEMLYNGLKGLIMENLDTLANEQITPVFPNSGGQDLMQGSQEAELLCKAVTKVHEDHCSNMVKLGQILKYMDRVYTNSAAVPGTWELGRILFREHIMLDSIRTHVINAILNQIRFEREGYVVNRSAIKGSVEVFTGLDSEDGKSTLYELYLEPAIITESESYYKAEGEKLLQLSDASAFLQRVEERYQSEDSRAHHYLSSVTASPLRAILKEHLLSPHIQTVILLPNSGLDVMIDSQKMEDLSRLYHLYSGVPTGLPCLKRALRESILQRGREINRLSVVVDEVDEDRGGGENEEGNSKRKGKIAKIKSANTGASQWVQNVLDLKDKFDTIWKHCWQSDRELESTLDEAYSSFVNMNDKAPEFISLFIDDHLRRGLKGKTDTEVDAVLDKTIIVFRFISEKDIFERYYKNHLAKRLLHNRSVSDDAERGMLAKLKVECGFQFTQKLEGMFHDMKLSDEHMGHYRTYLGRLQSSPPELELSVTIMTATFWPMSQAPPSCRLPPLMTQACNSYQRFYNTRHSGRRLTWLASLGNADVKVRFKSRQHELNVSTYALVILLLFQNLGDGETLSYSDIKEATGIDDLELRRQLQSIACGKYKVLKKHPPGREVKDSDVFHFNEGFQSDLHKIKIAVVSAKVESGEERKETRDRVDEERKHQTDACVVRIMKDRKHMSHNDLINEVTRQLASRFQPEPFNIKKRIENLIEREYLERCDDRKSYNYLA